MFDKNRFEDKREFNFESEFQSLGQGYEKRNVSSQRQTSTSFLSSDGTRVRFKIINQMDSHLNSEPVGIIATKELCNWVISLIDDGLRLDSSLTDFFQFIGHIRTCDTWREF